jgi:hypothetical protein
MDGILKALEFISAYPFWAKLVFIAGVLSIGLTLVFAERSQASRLKAKSNQSSKRRIGRK